MCMCPCGCMPFVRPEGQGQIPYSWNYLKVVLGTKLRPSERTSNAHNHWVSLHTRKTFTGAHHTLRHAPHNPLVPSCQSFRQLCFYFRVLYTDS